jgi:tetratricopeptide (TPR) repeat protein
MLKLRDISRKYKLYIERVNILYNLIFISLKTGNIDMLEELQKETDEISKRVSSQKVTARKMYLDGITAGGGDSLLLYDSALEIAKSEKMKDTEWNIYNSTGDCYFEKGRYYDSTRYYFEACEIIKNCTLQVPEEMRVRYINNQGRLIPFNKLQEIKSLYKSEGLKDIDGYKPIIVNNLEELNNLFKYKGFWEILDNEHFIKTAEKIKKTWLKFACKRLGILRKANTATTDIATIQTILTTPNFNLFSMIVLIILVIICDPRISRTENKAFL